MSSLEARQAEIEAARQDGAAGDRVAVIGGGVSGVAAAYYLRRAGRTPEIIEAGPALGGRCATAQLDGHEITYGGKNIGKHYRCFREFTRAMGDHPYEYHGINSSRADGDKLRRFDSQRKLRSALDVVIRTPKRDLVRFAAIAAAVRADEERRYLGSPLSQRLAGSCDRSLGERFSSRYCDSALRPLTVIPNGAEPDELYMSTVNANIGMVLDSYDQLVHGIGPVLEAFAREHDVLLGTRAESLMLRGERAVGVCVRTADGAIEERPYGAVLIAAPAFCAASLVRSHRPALAAALDRVRYFAGAVVIAHYRRDIFGEEVRAVTFGKDDPICNAGVYWAGERDIIRYTFSGRAARNLLADDPDEERLLHLAEERLNRYVRVGASDRVGFVSKRWEHAHCAHLADHPRFLREVGRELDSTPGLALAGDYLRGASIEACFRSARDSVAKLVGSGIAH